MQTDQLVASMHSYNFNYCITSSCWDQVCSVRVIDSVHILLCYCWFVCLFVVVCCCCVVCDASGCASSDYGGRNWRKRLFRSSFDFRISCLFCGSFGYNQINSNTTTITTGSYINTLMPYLDSIGVTAIDLCCRLDLQFVIVCYHFLFIYLFVVCLGFVWRLDVEHLELQLRACAH